MRKISSPASLKAAIPATWTMEMAVLIRQGLNFDVWGFCPPFVSLLRFEAKAGRGAQIWTGDFLLPKQARCQAAPRPDDSRFSTT